MTIYGFPPATRTEPAPGVVLSGAPVSAVSTWQPIAAGVNWLNGTGAMLIPGSDTILTNAELVGGTDGTWNFNTYTRAQAIARVWEFMFYGRAAESGASCSIVINGGASMSFPVSPLGAIGAPPPTLIVETLGSQSAALAPMTVKFSAAAGKYVTLASVSCWELSRPALLQSSDDHGINFQSIRPREKVYAPTYPGTIESVGGVYSALADADARRVGLYSWAVPQESPKTRVGAYVDLLGLPAPILLRQLTAAQWAGGTGTAYWSAFAKVSASSGDVKITTSLGVTDSVNITGTSYAWTTPRAIQIQCEDLTTIDGRPSATWNDVQFAIRGNGGATLSLAGLAVFEQP